MASNRLTNGNGKMSYKLVGIIISIFLFVLRSLFASMRGIMQDTRRGFAADIDQNSSKIGIIEVKTATNEVEITGIREDMREVKGDVSDIREMTREIYRFTTGK